MSHWLDSIHIVLHSFLQIYLFVFISKEQLLISPFKKYVLLAIFLFLGIQLIVS